MRRAVLISTFLLITLLAPQIGLVAAWSNGGYSSNINNPDYGTHDWIAQHALDWLPAEKKQYITDNLASYLYGTELPDLPSTQGGIGDTTKHHIYYSAAGAPQDDAAAIRAEAEYQAALTYLKAGNKAEAAKHAGAMTHYIADMAVFGHVMGASTDWGTETHHSDYENRVTTITSTYSTTYIKPLQYDGTLTTLSAANAANQLALDTTLNAGGTYTASWMDQNYDWSNIAFSNRSWESVNLATNTIADTLSTLYDASAPAKTATTITCTSSKTTATDAEQITISGAINANITATVTISKYTSGIWTPLTTTQTTNGAYMTRITLQAGTYTLRATWLGDAAHDGATSQTTILTVTHYNPPKTQTTITINPSKINAKENEQITISGTINTDISTTVTISQYISGTWAPLTTTQTTNGAYITKVILQMGTYTLRATWPGDAAYEAAESTQTTIMVQPRTSDITITILDEKNAPLTGATVTTTQTPINQSQLIGTTRSDGTITFTATRIGTYTFNATKTGYKSNTVTTTTIEDQTNTQTIQLTRKENGIPAYPVESITLGLVIILGYFIIKRMNQYK